MELLTQVVFPDRSYFEEIVEKPFLSALRDDWSEPAVKILDEEPMSLCIAEVRSLISGELTIFGRFLDAESEKKAVQIVEDKLINMLIVKLPKVDLAVLMKERNIADLQKLTGWAQLSSTWSTTMRSQVEAYLREEGLRIIGDEKNPLQKILNLNNEYNWWLCHAFLNDKQFEHMLQNQLSYFLSLDANNPKYLAQFVDEKLRRKNVSF
jgi:hypothetical protein